MPTGFSGRYKNTYGAKEHRRMIQRERLAELLGKAEWLLWGETVHSMQERRERIADYLLENGAVVPLCKCGDTVYQIDDIRIYELEVFEIYVHENNTYYGAFDIDFDDTAIGTSIFLTREEAEKALEERCEE